MERERSTEYTGHKMSVIKSEGSMLHAVVDRYQAMRKAGKFKVLATADAREAIRHDIEETEKVLADAKAKFSQEFSD